MKERLDQDSDSTTDDRPLRSRRAATTRSTVAPNLPRIAVTSESPGRYQILGERGRGAIGQVFSAYDAHIGRHLAIKQLLSETGDDGSSPRTLPETPSVPLIRFLREARITAQLQHPSIVPVYEIGRRADGSYYYTMKLVRGKTLRDAIHDAKSLEGRLKLLPHFRDLCQAIAYSHSHDVIHRDIKPSNVMIGEFGETVVLDWGLAKVSGERDIKRPDSQPGIQPYNAETQAATVDGSTVGTPAYMAPEQAAGKVDEVDKLSDVYALGAVLYYILTGHPPYSGSSPLDTIEKVLREPFAPIDSEPHPPPRELAAIAEKALAREKRDRFQTAAELVAEVEAFMSGEKVTAYEYSSLELLERFAKKNKAIIAATVLALAAVIVALIFTTVSYERERASNKKMLAAIEKEQIARETETASKTLAHYHMAQGLGREASLLEAKMQFAGASIYAAASLLNNPATKEGPNHDVPFVAQYPESLQLRAEAASRIYRAQLLPSTRLKRIMESEDAVYTTAFSPNGALLASGGADKKLRVWDTATGKLVRVLEGHKNTLSNVAFSPNGMELASAGLDAKVNVWDVATGQLVRTLTGHAERVWSVAYCPNGEMLATAGADRVINIWNARTGKLTRKLRVNTSVVTSIACSPDGKRLASTGADMRITVWDLAQARVLRSMKAGDRIWKLAFSPDGTRIAASCFDNDVYQWESATGKLLRRFKGHGDRVYAIAYSTDGKVLGSGGMDNTIRFWDAQSGELLLNLDGHEGIVMSLSFSPDGRSFATGSYDKTVKVRALSLDKRITVLKGHADRIADLAYSPLGDVIATGGLDETVRLFDAKNGKPLKVLRGHRGMVYAVAFTPNGKRVVSGAVDKLVRVWDAESGLALATLEGHTDVVNAVAVSPDGNQIISGGEDRSVLGWDVKTGQQLFALRKHAGAVWALAYAPGGKRFATGAYDNRIYVWDAQSGAVLNEIESPDWVSGLTFSPDGATLYSCGKDATAIAWDTTTSKMIRRYRGHKQWVNFVSASPDGALLATSSDDQTVYIWSVQTAEPLLVIDTREGLAVELSPFGRAVAVGDKTIVKVFPLDDIQKEVDPEALLARATHEAGLQLDGFVTKQMSAEVFHTNAVPGPR